MNFNKILIIFIKSFLFLTAITPLILTRGTIFPFIFGKMVFFRGAIELALILFLVYLVYSFYKNNWKLPARFALRSKAGGEIGNWKFFKNPLFILIILFFIFLTISTIFAVNNYRAFWGDTERAEGLFGMFHYLAMLAMMVLIFQKKDWLNYFKISLFTGLIVIFYGFLEYFGVRGFPFMAMLPSPRPGSYIGNPAFLATYMFFVIAFATTVFFEAPKRVWRYFSLLTIILAAIMIFLTGTRGAILGLGAGVFALLIYFSIFGGPTFEIQFKKIRLNLQKLSICLLILILFSSAVFWFTRDNAVWQKIPGINRLAQMVSGFDKESIQMRWMSWKIGWQAFKERPILGWGPENYLVAYQKNYNPDMSFWGETWVDRAHNKILDLLAMQGIVGLITYLLMFGGIFYLLFQRKSTLINTDDKLISADKSNKSSAEISQKISGHQFIAAILIAYFVQNLVLFDQITSYIPFFVVLGYIVSNSIAIQWKFNRDSIEKNNRITTELQSNYSRVTKYLSSVIVIAIVIVLSYVLYFYNYIPYTQAKTFKQSSLVCQGKKTTEEECVALITKKVKKAMYPYNFTQYNIRGQGVDQYYLNQFFYQIELIENPKFKPLVDLLIQGQEDIINKEPYDVRLFIRVVEMINPLAAENPELYKKTENLIRQALEIAPKRQELYYNLAFALAGQGRFEESIETARYAIGLSKLDIARSRYHLGLMLFLADQKEAAAKELVFAEELEPNFKNFLPGDLNNTAFIYTEWGRGEKVAELVIRHLNGEIGPLNFGFKREYYEIALSYFALIHDKENLIKTAVYLTRYKDIKDHMEVLIDLAEKENWEIIDKL